MSLAGGGRTVPLRDADQELRLAWQALDEESRRSRGEGMLRLREANLVVACDEESLEEARTTAALVTRSHPARVIVVVADAFGDTAPPPPSRGGQEGAAATRTGAAAKTEEASASIATACVLGGSAEHHACSEEVLVRAPDGDDRALQAAVVQLLVPDVPVVGWWAGRARDGAGPVAGLKWLAGISDQVVMDVRAWSHAGSALEVLQELAATQPDTALRELEWLRCERWRILTAELFAQGGPRALIPHLSRLTVEHERAPVQALFYGAWFGSRLGLAPSPLGWRNEDGSLCIDLVASGETEPGAGARPRSLLLELCPACAGEHGQAGLTAVRVAAAPSGSQEAVSEELSLTLRPHSCVCSAELGRLEEVTVVKSQRFSHEDDAAHLGRIIDTPLRDRLFETSLQLAVEAIERPGFDLDLLDGAAGCALG